MHLFIHVNKCGGTSFKQAFKDSNVFTPPGDDVINLSNKSTWHQYNKFTIVRHPVTRLLSLQGMILKLYNTHVSIDEIIDLVEDNSIKYNSLSFDLFRNEYIKRHALPFTHKHYQVYKNGKLNMEA